MNLLENCRLRVVCFRREIRSLRHLRRYLSSGLPRSFSRSICRIEAQYDTKSKFSVLPFFFISPYHSFTTVKTYLLKFTFTFIFTFTAYVLHPIITSNRRRVPMHHLSIHHSKRLRRPRRYFRICSCQRRKCRAHNVYSVLGDAAVLFWSEISDIVICDDDPCLKEEEEEEEALY